MFLEVTRKIASYFWATTLVFNSCICAADLLLLIWSEKAPFFLLPLQNELFHDLCHKGLWYFEIMWRAATVAQGIIATSHFSVHAASDVTKMGCRWFVVLSFFNAACMHCCCFFLKGENCFFKGWLVLKSQNTQLCKPRREKGASLGWCNVHSTCAFSLEECKWELLSLKSIRCSLMSFCHFCPCIFSLLSWGNVMLVMNNWNNGQWKQSKGKTMGWRARWPDWVKTFPLVFRAQQSLTLHHVSRLLSLFHIDVVFSKIYFAQCSPAFPENLSSKISVICRCLTFLHHAFTWETYAHVQAAPQTVIVLVASPLYPSIIYLNQIL